MSNRIFVDTSFVLALINERDQYHDKAEALSYKFDSSSLVTTEAILLEIGNALAKDFRKEAVAIIKVLRGSQRVEVVGIDTNLLGTGLEIYEKYRDKTWGLVDCISFAVMREKMLAEVLTFDGDFTQAGFTIVSD